MHRVKSDRPAVTPAGPQDLRAQLAANELKLKSLQETERRYEMLAELTSEFAYEFNVSEEKHISVVWLGGPLLAITGYSHAELEERGGWQTIVHSDDRRAFLDHVRNLLEGRDDTVELRINTKDGRTKWLSNHARGFTSQSCTRVDRIYGVATDITERKKARQAILDSRQKYHKLFEDAAVAIVMFRPSGEIVDFNRRALTQFGYRVREFDRLNVSVLFTAESWSDAQRLITVLKEDGAVTKPLVMLARGERSFVADVSISVLSLQGEPIIQCVVRDETDRERALSALQESRNEFRRVVEQASDLILRIGADGLVDYVNPGAARFFGRSEDDLCGTPFQDLARSDYREVVRRFYERQIEERIESTYLEYPAATAAKGEVWLGQSVQLIYEGDEVVGLQGIARDETSRRSSEQAMRASEERFRSIFYRAGNGIVMAQMDGTIVETNPAAQQMFGYSSSELIEKGLSAIIHPIDRERAAEDVAELQQDSSGNRQAEIRYMRRDGRVIWGRTTISLALDWKGDPLHPVYMIEDITEQKHAQEALRLTQFSVDRAGDAIFWLRHDGKFLYANDAGVATLGRDREALLQMFIHQIDPNMPKEVWHEHWEDVKQRGSLTIESAFVNSNGHQFPVEVTANHLEFDGQEYQFAFVRNITERKRHEAQLVRTREEAEQMSALKSAFLTNISHEIRTPLAAIIGFASILDEEMPERHQKFLRFIERSGKRLLDTMNSIINLSMLEAGSYEIQRETFDIVTQISEQVQLLRPLAEEKGIELELMHAAAEIEVFTDRTCIDRIVNNLVGNAIKFTDQGRVVVEVASSRDEVELKVVDTGIGISHEFIDSVFDEFKQESEGSTRDYEGIGLGLTITKRLVDLLGGEVDVDSIRGEGSAFRIVLPTRRIPGGAAIARDQVPARSTPAVAPVSSGKPRVLAVEDNPDMLALLEHLLRERCEVFPARDGDSAMQQAVSGSFDLVLMDINLGTDETGVDVLQRLRKLDQYRHVPIVAVTAYALPGDRDRFLQAGFDGYIGKPFSKQQLIRMVDQILTV